MQSTEAKLAAGWWAVAIVTGLAMIFPTLPIMLFFTIVLMPLAFIMLFAPTVFLYTAVPGALLLILRWIRRSWSLSLGIALAVLGFEIAIANWFATDAQRQTLEAVKELTADDTTRSIPATPVRTVIAFSFYSTYEEKGDAALECNGTCQRTLFSGYARQYAIGARGRFDPSTAQQQVQVIHKLIPLGEGCDNSLLSASPVEDGDFVPDVSKRRYLWDVLPALADQGLCFTSERNQIVTGDIITVRDTRNYRNEARDQLAHAYDWRRKRINQVSRTEIYVKSGEALARRARQTEVRYALVNQPISIDLPSNFAVFRAGGWADRTASSVPEIPFLQLADLVDRDFSIRIE